MSSFTNILGKVAPWLAAAASGPVGLAGMAIKTVANALDVKDATADNITAAIAGATPEQMLAIKKAEADFKTRMEELGLTHETDMARLAVDDRKDARQMQIAVHSLIPGTLAVGITLGFFGVLGAMLAGVWKPADNNALLILLGSLGTSWGAIVNYYFGSSASSARKDDVIARQAN